MPQFEFNLRKHLRIFQDMPRNRRGPRNSFGSFVENFVAYTYENCVVSGDVVLPPMAARRPWLAYIRSAKLVGPEIGASSRRQATFNRQTVIFFNTRKRNGSMRTLSLCMRRVLQEHGMTKISPSRRSPGLSDIKCVGRRSRGRDIHVPHLANQEIAGWRISNDCLS